MPRGVKENTGLCSRRNKETNGITDKPGRSFWGQMSCELRAPPSLYLFFPPHPEEASSASHSLTIPWCSSAPAALGKECSHLRKGSQAELAVLLPQTDTAMCLWPPRR